MKKMIKCCKLGLFILSVIFALVMATTAMAAEEGIDNFFGVRLGVGGLNDPVAGTGILVTSVGADYYTGPYSVGVEYSTGIGGGLSLSNINMNAGYYISLVRGTMLGYGRLGYGSTSGGGGISGGGLVYEIGIQLVAGGLIDIGYKNFSINSGPLVASAGGFFIGMTFPF